MRLLLLTVLAIQPPFSSHVSPVIRADLPHSWRPGCPVAPSRLRRLRLSYWGFDGKAHTGQLIANGSAVGDLITVFRRLYGTKFPLRRMRPIDLYRGSDERSLAAPTLRPHGLACAGGKLFVSDDHSGRVCVLDLLSGIVERSFEAPGPRATGLACAGDVLFLLERKSGQIYKVLPEDGTIRAGKWTAGPSCPP